MTAFSALLAERRRAAAAGIAVTVSMDDRQERSIHDEEVNAARERVASSWVQRAQAGILPAKEYGR